MSPLDRVPVTRQDKDRARTKMKSILNIGWNSDRNNFKVRFNGRIFIKPLVDELRKANNALKKKSR